MAYECIAWLMISRGSGTVVPSSKFLSKDTDHIIYRETSSSSLPAAAI